MRSRGRLTPSLSPPSSYSAHSHTSGGLVSSSSLFKREARRSPILSEHCIDTRAKLRRSSASAIVDDRRPTLDWRGLVLVYCRVANTSRTLLAASPSAFEFPVSTIVYTRPRTSVRTESCLLIPLCPLYYKSSRTNIRRVKDVRQCLSFSHTHSLSLSLSQTFLKLRVPRRLCRRTRHLYDDGDDPVATDSQREDTRSIDRCLHTFGRIVDVAQDDTTLQHRTAAWGDVEGDRRRQREKDEAW